MADKVVTQVPGASGAAQAVADWVSPALAPAMTILANGGAIAVLVWLVVVQMPRQQDSYREDLRLERESQVMLAKELARAIEGNTKATRDLVNEMKALKTAKMGGGN